MYGKKNSRIVSMILVLVMLITLFPGVVTQKVKAAEIPLVEVNGPTTVEAENMYYLPWVNSTTTPGAFEKRLIVTGDASQGERIKANGLGPSQKPALDVASHLEFNFRASVAADYSIWFRVNPNNSGKDMWILNPEQNPPDFVEVELDTTIKEYNWKRVMTYTGVTPGEVINFKGLIKNGDFSIDKIYIAPAIFDPTIPVVPATGITVSSTGDSTKVGVGNTLQMSAMVAPENATAKTVAWSVYSGSGATIDSTGLVTGTAVGQVTIRATAIDGSGVFGEKIITVTGEALPQLVTGITVGSAGNADSVDIGKTLQMTAQVAPENATEKSVTWSVYEGSGATIDAAGLLTATAKGLVTIRATANDGSQVYGQKSITMIDPNRVLAETITVSGQGGTLRMDTGTMLQMTAQVAPANASDKTVTWSLISSIKPGSSIDASTGVITAGGKADRLVIRATANDSSQVYGEITITVLDTTVVSEYPAPPYALVAGHPRLYFRSSDIPTIKANTQKKENKNAWEAHVKNLSKVTDGKLPRSASTVENFSESVLAIIESYAFDYALYGNEASGRAAINAMRNYVNTVVFNTSETGSIYNKTGVTIYTISAVYDWCYPLLTEDDRNLFVQKVCEFTEYKTGYPPTKLGNINGHGDEGPILRDMMSAAVAMGDEYPFLYRNVAGRYFNRMVEPRKYLYQAHANLNGLFYSSYRSPWYILSALIVDRAFNIPQIYGPDHQYLLYWPMYAQRPDSGQLKDGDGSSFSKPFNRPATLFGGYYKDTFLKYFQIRQNLDFSVESPYYNISMNPVEFLIFNDPNVEPTPFSQLPLTKYFPSPRGGYIARTGWEEGVKAPTVVAEMKINEVFIGSHQHLDAGSFQIYYKGALAIDEGIYKGAVSGNQWESSDYASDHWLNYSIRTAAHNSITVMDPDEVYKPGSPGFLNDGGQRYPAYGVEPGTVEDLTNPDSPYRTGKVLGHEYGLDPVTPNYTYLKGDLTGAYSSKISDFERSFMFLNLKEKDHPAAMIVFDRVISSNENFKKSWLLHGLEAPEISGNQTIFRNTRLDERSGFQYNGKLTVDTLLPKADNTEITTIGGPGQEHWAAGSSHYGKPNGTTEGVGYRIEVSPKTPAQTDYFLNVLQMTDANPDVPALPVTMIETEKLVGVVVSDRVVVLGRSKERTQEPVEFSFINAGEFEITVADLKEGTWNITKDGNPHGTAVATAEGGVGVFMGGPGAYRLTRQSFDGLRAPVEPQPVKDPGIQILANDYPVYSEISPVKEGNSLLVPVQALKQLHTEVTEAGGTATITHWDIEVKLTADSDTAYVDNEPRTMPAPARLQNGKLLVPVDFISQVLYMNSTYYENVKVLSIKEKESNKGTPEEGYITIMDSTASEIVTGSEPNKSYDNTTATYWAAEGATGQWVQYDLGKAVEIPSVLIMWHNKHQRQAIFNIEVSDDGTSWRKLFENNITGELGIIRTFEEFALPAGTKARYVKIVSFGTTKDNKNTINEIKFKAAPVPVSHVVTFMNNGAIHATKTVTTPAATVDALPQNPSRTGYVFDGWKMGDGTPFTADTAITADMTVEASWILQYTLTLGAEENGGAGKMRTITVGGASAVNLDGKYLVVQLTSGTGEAAKVAVIMISITEAVSTVSYPVENTTVQVWLTSAMPNLGAEDMGVAVYAYTGTGQ